MKSYHKAIFLLSMFLCSLAVAKNLPNGIKVLVGGQAFFDGGSTILEFTDFDGIEWQAFLNKSLSEKKKKRIDSITITVLSNGFGEKVIHQEGKLLKKDSKEERRFISSLEEAIEHERAKDDFALQMAKEFLEKKKRSNQAVDTTRAKRPELWTQQGRINPTTFSTGL